MQLREQVAEEVRALLGRRQVSQQRLAEALGRSQAYVSRRTNGGVAFDLDDLEAIAAMLDVFVCDLFPPPTHRTTHFTVDAALLREATAHDYVPVHPDGNGSVH